METLEEKMQKVLANVTPETWEDAPLDPPEEEEEEEEETKADSLFVFLVAHNKYMHKNSRLMCTRQALVTALGRKVFAQIVESSPIVMDARWDPKQRPGDVYMHKNTRYYNTLTLPTQVEGGSEKPFRDFVQALCGQQCFPDTDRKVADWLEDWIAYKFQNIWQKTLTLAIVGPQGCGKSSLWRGLTHIIGPHQTSSMGDLQSALDGQFQDYKANRLYAFFHEVHSSKYVGFRDKQGVAARYKELADPVGELAAHLNIKYGGQRQGIVACTVGIATNYPDALPLEADDRRTTVIAVETVPKKLVAAMSDALGVNLAKHGLPETDANIWATYEYYMNRDVSGFDWQHAPWTEAKGRMIDGNVTISDEFCEDFLQKVAAAGGAYNLDQAKRFAAERDMDTRTKTLFLKQLRGKSYRKKAKWGNFYQVGGELTPKEAKEAMTKLNDIMSGKHLKAEYDKYFKEPGEAAVLKLYQD